LLRDLGATPVAYGDGLADRVRVLAPSGVDAALDLVGTDEAVDVSVELVEDRHRIASIVAFGRGPELGIQLLGGGPGADAGTEIRNAARRQLTAAFADGNLQVLVARSFPLTQVAEAHRHISAGHTNGKTVLVP
jgi:NADPH:quinone reductase-like Zn-dependent oxidoreductase